MDTESISVARSEGGDNEVIYIEGDADVRRTPNTEYG